MLLDHAVSPHVIVAKICIRASHVSWLNAFPFFCALYRAIDMVTPTLNGTAATLT